MKQILKDYLVVNNKLVSKRCTKLYFTNNNISNLYDQIENYASDHYKFSEKVWMIIQGISPCKCIMCGKDANIKDGSTPSNKIEFSDYCSNLCKNSNMSNIMKEAVKGRDEIGAQRKREETNLVKTGYRYNSQRPEIKHILKQSKLDPVTEQKLSNKVWLHEQVHINNLPSTAIGDILGCDYTTVLSYMDRHGIPRNKNFKRSSQEIKVETYIRSVYTDDIELCNLTILDGKEIDIFLPKLKIGFEIDGLRYHSTKEVNYHKNKTVDAMNNGVRLFHFTDKEINEQFDLVSSMINSRLGLTKTIHARKCVTVVLTHKEASSFFEMNHIGGNTNASIYIGLRFDGEIVSAMSFSKPRFSKEADWELIRYATSMGKNVVGGASKMLNKFRTHNNGSIISYCDLRYGTGNVYDSIGFLYLRTTSPGYFWTNGTKVISRYKSQKKNLPKLLGDKYTPGTETESMENAGYRKFWDCGNSVWILS